MPVETERHVTPGIGYPALPGPDTTALGWPGDDGVTRAQGVDGDADITSVSRETFAAVEQEAMATMPDAGGTTAEAAVDATRPAAEKPTDVVGDVAVAARSEEDAAASVTPNATGSGHTSPVTSPDADRAEDMRGGKTGPGESGPAGETQMTTEATAVHESADATVSRETSELTDSERAADAFAKVSRGAQGEGDPSVSSAVTDTPVAQAVAEDARKREKLAGRTLPRPSETRVLTVANQKGGVGKTTTAVNIAAALAQAGATVLVVDLDPQGNASTALGIEHHSEVPSIYDVLVDGDALSTVVQSCPDVEGLYCAPATIDLAGAEIELVSLVARETRLKKAITAYQEELAERGERLDYVFVDCPPSLGLLTVNAFVAAQEVFIPIQCEYYALEGLSALLKNIELIRNHLNQGLHVSTILLTMYDGRTRLSAQVAEEVRNHFPDQTLRATVPRSVRISEAPSHGQTVMTYDPNSSGALSYLEAASEMAAQNAAENSEDRS